VLRGPLGFGRSGVLHTDKILRLSFDSPIVIEIIDSDQKIRAFLPQLAAFDHCVITVAEVQALGLRDDTTQAPSPIDSTGPPSNSAGDV
jgi:uncharacterized protein